MVASDLVKMIHPCAQHNPKVSYLFADVPIEHSINSPPVKPIGGVHHHSVFLTLFAISA